jgi:YYY domain-containing protein
VSAVEQALFVIAWLAVLKLLQLAVWPALKETFSDLAYAVAYPASVLLFVLISWYAGLFAIPVELTFIPFVLLAGWHGWRGAYRRQAWAKTLRFDAAFLLCFLFMLEVRYFNPSISYAEKFMDHAFLASIMQNPIVPPVDPWYAGGTLDVYYYLGHWMAGALGIVAGVPSTIVFNLILPTVLGLAAVSLYALGNLLLRKYRWLPVLTLFLVNPSFLLHALLGEDIHTIMWESTRTITSTINEFPLFSMLWGDPHAHVISFFNQAFFLFLVVFAVLRWRDCSGRGRWILIGTTALSLGSMPLINSWDVLVYASVLLLAGGLIWWRERGESLSNDASWRFALIVPPLSILLYLPYYLQLNTQGIAGVGIVTTPSDPLQFLLVHGFFIAVFVWACRTEIRTRPVLLLIPLAVAMLGYPAAAIALLPLVYLVVGTRRDPAAGLAILGLAVVILTEMIYLMDNMGEVYFRMNTVFKFGLPAWLMMGSAAFVMIGEWLQESGIDRHLPERTAAKAAVLILLILVALPVLLPDLSYGYGSKTLDGSAWLEERHPGDAAAIAWLRGLEEQPTIVEAEGGDYSYHSRISSFTGMPTIIGMPFHEQMWRGEEGEVGRRMADVRTIYEEPDETIPLMKEYGAELLYVGELERERYRVDIPEGALLPIYNESDVQIYSIKPRNTDS